MVQITGPAHTGPVTPGREAPGTGGRPSAPRGLPVPGRGNHRRHPRPGTVKQARAVADRGGRSAHSGSTRVAWSPRGTLSAWTKTRCPGSRSVMPEPNNTGTPVHRHRRNRDKPGSSPPTPCLRERAKGRTIRFRLPITHGFRLPLTMGAGEMDKFRCVLLSPASLIGHLLRCRGRPPPTAHPEQASGTAKRSLLPPLPWVVGRAPRSRRP